MKVNILIKRLFCGKALKSLKDENAQLREDLKIYQMDEKVPLTQFERNMIKVALAHPGFKKWVEEPQMRAFYRIVYRKLREKIRRSINLGG